MASKILKGLAVAAGTGLAIGFGSKRKEQANSMSDSSENILALAPLLDRLDLMEARIGGMEASQQSAATLVESLLETTLRPKVEELRVLLHAEMRESVAATLTSFGQAIEDKVSDRISTLEKALIDQSAIVTALSQRAVEAEENFHRLITAVERLCERSEPSAPARHNPPLFELPFERQLSEAFQRQPAASASSASSATSATSASPPDSGFRPRIVREDDSKQRHRKPMTRL